MQVRSVFKQKKDILIYYLVRRLRNYDDGVENEYIISVLFLFQYAGWLKERSICGKSAYFFEVVSIKQKYFIYLLLYCCVVLDPID